MSKIQTNRRRFYQTIAIVTSALGLSTACGIGARPSMPSKPPPPPPPKIALSAQLLTFDKTVVGTRSPAQQLTITNNDVQPLHFTSHPFGPPFQLDANTCEGAIPAGQSCTVTFSFRPEQPGKSFGAMNFSLLDHSSIIIRLAGEATLAPSAP